MSSDVIFDNSDRLAFPVADYSNGLSKREYFAALAMQGLSTGNTMSPRDTAKSAVELADRLLEELGKERSSHGH